MNRSVEFCRYYRSVFQVVQQSVSDSNSISAILLKIWDLAATSASGLSVRDAYRSIKALPRRAKELGRNVASYTIDLYSQLEKMGKGTVERCGRVVRFFTGVTDSPTTPEKGGVDPVTVVTVPKSDAGQSLEVSPLLEVSPVTDLDIRQVDVVTDDIEVLNLSSPIDELLVGGIVAETELVADGLVSVPENATINKPTGFSGELLSDAEMAAWHERLNSCKTLDQVMDFHAALDALSPEQRQQFESSVSEDTWTLLWNLPYNQEQESEPSEVEPKSAEPTIEELIALLNACNSLVQLSELKRKHKNTVAKAYSLMSDLEQGRVDALSALSVPYKVFKYKGEEIRQGTQQLIKGTLVYLDPKAQIRTTAHTAPVWSINGVRNGWSRPINVTLSLLQEVVKAGLPEYDDGSQQVGLI